MTLIKSISGIRGTIGGKPGEGLNPIDTVKFSAAYGTWVKQRKIKKKFKIVIGRDARISGQMMNNLVTSTITGLGIDVIDAGLATTPTVELAVEEEKADGGIILTASHNPKEWNALKLLNDKGEFISETKKKKILDIANAEDFKFAGIDALGKVYPHNYTDSHIEKIINLSLVDLEAIKNAEFKIAVDCVNSVGGIAVPRLLEKLGVMEIIKINADPTGEFAHNPEPIPENLTHISEKMASSDIHAGFVVDPDVDRLAIIMENGEMFGEEYTLVSVADYVLQHKSGNTVSNLSSTKALQDITEKHGGKYYASAVGEVNVVQMMKDKKAIIGGEGNGGVIYPKLHYGRDALAGIALFLSHLAKSGMTCSQLKATYPEYHIAKKKIKLEPEINVDEILDIIKDKYSKYPVNDTDGVKISFEEEWVHLRKSNTEPIIRIYAESRTMNNATSLASKIMEEIKNTI